MSSASVRGALVLLGLLFCLVIGSMAQPRPEVTAPTGDEGFPKFYPKVPRQVKGSNLQHSLRLLAGLRCDGARPVRVLFYGQSITEQNWWKEVAEFLRTSYPGTPLIIENRAIGGHSADRLMKTIDADVYPFNPDLVIFHVYGSSSDYESIIRKLRERTTADLMISTDHVLNKADLEEETRPELQWLWRWTKWAGWLWPRDTRISWTSWFNGAFLPRLSRLYGVELVDVRSDWKEYLEKNHLSPEQLLSDQIHLNTHGEYLMAQIFKRYLSPVSLRQSTCESNRSKQWVAGRDFIAANGHVRIRFFGTRAHVVFRERSAALVAVYIDGKPPSQRRTGYEITRSTSYPGTNWPTLLKVDLGPTLPQAEKWKIKIRPTDSSGTRFKFDIAGTVTGPDGSGDSETKFISNSKRIIIDSSFWNIVYAMTVYKIPLPKDLEVNFSVTNSGMDSVDVRNEAGNEFEVVSGLDNRLHTLDISGENISEIVEVRTYKPRN